MPPYGETFSCWPPAGRDENELGVEVPDDLADPDDDDDSDDDD